MMWETAESVDNIVWFHDWIRSAIIHPIHLRYPKPGSSWVAPWHLRGESRLTAARTLRAVLQQGS